jgi:hypothetical protein
MPAPHLPDPNPDSSWPSCGNDQPGVSIRPLRQADLAALLAHLNPHDQQAPGDGLPEPAGPTPILARRVRASVGRPRASARAAGERRTARLLAPLERRGWAVLHDLAIPGSPANIDHLVIGPGGVLIIDTKQYRGRLRFDPNGLVWHGRHLLVATLRKVLWQADQADEVLGVAEIQVPAIVAVHGAAVPRGRVDTDGVTVIPARQLPDLLRALPPILGPERVAWLADRARLRFHPAA